MRSCVILLVSELSRLGRNAFEVLETVKELADSGINLYMQKEQMTLLGDDGKPSIFAPIMLATLSTCAQLERDNISFRLNSGRKQYVEKGGKLGRPSGSTKSQDKKREEYRKVINLLNKGYAIRDVAKLTGKGISTVQRVKKEFVAWTRVVFNPFGLTRFVTANVLSKPDWWNDNEVSKPVPYFEVVVSTNVAYCDGGIYTIFPNKSNSTKHFKNKNTEFNKLTDEQIIKLFLLKTPPKDSYSRK